MDTSAEYIKMCNCEEIQGIWSPWHGDFYIHSGELKYLGETIDGIRKNVINCRKVMNEPCIEFLRKILWLPRQDQLQKMVWDNQASDIMNICGLLDRLQHMPIGFDCRSMEQLWLAFVMHEKFNKKWNGEKWVEII